MNDLLVRRLPWVAVILTVALRRRRAVSAVRVLLVSRKRTLVVLPGITVTAEPPIRDLPAAALRERPMVGSTARASVVTPHAGGSAGQVINGRASRTEPSAATTTLAVEPVPNVTGAVTATAIGFGSGGVSGGAVTGGSVVGGGSLGGLFGAPVGVTGALVAELLPLAFDAVTVHVICRATSASATL